MSSDVKRQRVCVFCVCCMLASAAVLRGGCAESISCCLSGSVKSISLWCCQHSGCAIIITRISAVHPHALQWLIIADFTAAIYSIVRKLKHIICKDWDFITVSFNFGVWSVINYCIVSACLHLQSKLTNVGSNQRHRVEVGEFHVLSQILGVLLQ